LEGGVFCLSNFFLKLRTWYTTFSLVEIGGKEGEVGDFQDGEEDLEVAIEEVSEEEVIEETLFETPIRR
jgi:hypothetical protein